jgi:hypothetical protein
MGERLKPIVQATLDKSTDPPAGSGSAGSAGSATTPSP